MESLRRRRYQGLGKDVNVSVFSGTFEPGEIASKVPCEGSVSARHIDNGTIFANLLRTEAFDVGVVVEPFPFTEVVGSLKWVVAMGVGFADGMNCSTNTRAMLMRRGFLEVQKFATVYFGSKEDQEKIQGCGMSQIVAACSAGRNRRCAEAFVKANLEWPAIERDILKGHSLESLAISKAVQSILRKRAQFRSCRSSTRSTRSFCFDPRNILKIFNP